MRCSNANSAAASEIAAQEQLSDCVTENVIAAMSCNVRARQTLKTLTTI